MSSTQVPPKQLRVSVVQTCSAAYSLEDTLEKLKHLTYVAKERDGSQFAVFPEAFIGGYPKYSTFGASIGDRSLPGRDEFLRYHSSAIEVPSSPAITFMERVSAETNVFLVVGVIEKDAGTLYCTIVFIDPQRGYVAKHRKLVPTATERIVWGQGDGSTLAVIEKAFQSPEGPQASPVSATLSAAICWENYMPLLRQHYYSQGTQLYCAPTVDARPTWQNSMAHIAIEGRCFVLSACQYAEEKDFPPDHSVVDAANRDPTRVMIGGGSVIISPLGVVLAGPLLKGEDVLTVQVDLNDCIRGKFDLDVAGHYSRPDVFSFGLKA